MEIVVIGMLILFSFDVYALFYPGATLSFVTPLIATKFYILPDILYDPLSVSTFVDNSAVVRRLYKGCPISMPYRFMLVELIELYMLDFDL